MSYVIENYSPLEFTIASKEEVPLKVLQEKIRDYCSLFNLQKSEIVIRVEGHWHTQEGFIDVDFGRWAKVTKITPQTITISLPDGPTLRLTRANGYISKAQIFPMAHLLFPLS